MAQPPHRPRLPFVLKVVVVITLLAVLGVMFVRSLRSARAEPYRVERARLQNWTLVLEPPSAPTAPLLAVRAPLDLVSGLFRQVFTRAMESLNTPTAASIPIVLQGEFAAALAGVMTPEELLAAAREGGLEAAAYEPRCLAHRRISQPGATQQAYFAVFESEAFERFRQELATRAIAPGTFDATALSPVMFVAAADSSFHRWLPIRVEAERDCVAPIEVS